MSKTTERTADCAFCKIASGEIEATVVLQDGDVVAFRDLHPKAPTHVLVIPRRHVATVNDLESADAALVGKLFLAARMIARQEKIADTGYRLIVNCGAGAGQTVFHLHLHLLGGRILSWPPG